VGGTEHAVGHLLYSRFWTKFLFDIGLVSVEEPFKKLFNQGMILGEDHSKMSKSRGNTINPDEVIENYGADALRLFEMFMGPLESEKPWSTDGLIGAKKFIDRVYRMFQFVDDKDHIDLEMIYNQTVKKVTDDFEKLAFNTAISQMMIFVNEVYKLKKINKQMARNFLKLLNPICPHITEEINLSILEINEELIYSEWPTFDQKKTEEKDVQIVVQVNGKLRAKINMKRDENQKNIENAAFQQENVIKFTENLKIYKIIYIKNKLINIVAK
jgi:leucyl-tRNA synthetase